MKNLLGIFTVIISLALFSTSCTKTGCPSVAKYDTKLDKEIRIEAVATTSNEDLICQN